MIFFVLSRPRAPGVTIVTRTYIYSQVQEQHWPNFDVKYEYLEMESPLLVMVLSQIILVIWKRDLFILNHLWKR